MIRKLIQWWKRQMQVWREISESCDEMEAQRMESARNHKEQP